ncbi:MAG: CRISPR-associated endonuclease Cas2 [Actinomycetota bacterium]
MVWGKKKLAKRGRPKKLTVVKNTITKVELIGYDQKEVDFMRLIAYDIPQDRTRTRVHKLLKGYLYPVQYSVFEGELSPERLEEAIINIRELINENEDSVRVYSICSSCIQKTRIYGVGNLYIDEGYHIL